MAPKRKDTEDTIDKPNTRRPQIVLRTLPPIVFTSPTNPLTFQLTMSVSGVKPLRSTAPQLEGRPSYERDFGIGSHEVYADPQVVQREFNRVNERVDDVKKDLKAARDALDQKISGLETRLTAKIDAQKAYMDDKFEQQEEKFQQRMSQLQLNLDSALETHSETVTRRLDDMDKRVNGRFAKVDENFAKVDENFVKVDENFSRVDENFAKVAESFVKVDERFSKVEDRLDTMEKDIGQIKQMLRQLLTQGSAPPTPLPSASSQAPFLVNPPEVVVHAPLVPAAGPSSPHPDAESVDDRASHKEQLVSALHSIVRKASRVLSSVNKSKEHRD